MLKEFYVGVKGVIKVADACLVLKTLDKDGTRFWSFPGGRIDDNETIHQALAREFSEEIPTLQNYQVGNVLNAYRLSHDLPDGRGLILIFYEIKAEPFNVQLSSEHIEYRWVTKETVRELQQTEGVSIEQGYYDAVVTALNSD